MNKTVALFMVFAVFFGLGAGCTGSSSTTNTPSPAVALTTIGAAPEVPTLTAPPEKPRSRTIEELAALQPGRERQQILEQGARLEGEVMVYSTATGFDSIVDDFMKKYPFVKAEVFNTRVPALVERATAESRAGRLGGDIHTGSMTSYIPLQDMFVKFNSPGAEFTVAPKAATNNIGLVVFVYNTRRVQPADVPTRVEDLLSPKFKGKLGIFAPPNTFPGLWANMLLETMGESSAREFLTKLSGQDLFYYDSPQIAEKALNSGQIDMNMQGSTSARRWVAEGLPVNWTAPEPTMGYANLIALFKDSKHPHAALLLIDYLLSSEAQNKMSAIVGFFTTKEVAAGEIDGVKLPKTIWLQTPERVPKIPEGTKIFEQLVMKK